MTVVPEACGRCATPLGPDTTPDENGWCASCRAAVVRTASRLAYVPSVLLAVLLFWLMGVLNLWESRFVAVIMALSGGLVWLCFKVSRRVAFELVRYRIRRALRR